MGDKLNTKYYLLLALAVFGLYLFTMHPTISPYRDSGDLIVSSYTEGIAHPPGYPLYVLLGKTFTIILPWSNIAYRVNLMSAVFGAGALALAARTLTIAQSGSPWAMISLLFLAFSPAYWRLSQVSEMYSLNAFFTAFILLLAAPLFNEDKDRPAAKAPALFLTAFIGGLAAGNHPTVILFYPVLAWFVFRRREFSPGDYAKAAVFFAAGYSIYLFLAIRSSAGPDSNWGNPVTLENFWRVITRSDYGGLRLHPEQSKFSWSAGIIILHLWVYLKALGEQFTWPVAALGFWGMYLRRKETFYRMLFWSLMLTGPAFVVFSNLPPGEKTTLPILETHLVMPNLLFAYFIAAAVRRLANPTIGKIVTAALLLYAFSVNFPKCDYRGHFFAYDYGRNLLSTVPPGGMIYNPDDSTAFIAKYVQAVQKKRTDIKLAMFYRTRWGYEQMKQRTPEILPAREISSGRELEMVLLDHNRRLRPVLSELPVKFPAGYKTYPYGLMYGLESGFIPSFSAAPFEHYVFRDDPGAGGNYDFFTGQVISYYSAGRNNLGLALSGAGRFDAARMEYKRALAYDPGLAPAKNNMGTLEYSLGNYGAAEGWFSAILADSPDDASALYNIGLTFKAEGKYDDALRSFRRAWEKRGSPDAGNELGLLLLGAGKTEEAAGVFGGVVKAHPGYAFAYYNMGLALKQAGRFAESRSYFEKYLGATADPREREEVIRMIRSLPQGR